MLPDQQHCELLKTMLDALELTVLPFHLPHTLLGMFSPN